MLKLLATIRDIFLILKRVAIEFIKFEKKSKVKKAVKEVDEEKSQEPMEEYLSGESGHPSRFSYHKLRRRKKKDRS